MVISAIPDKNLPFTGMLSVIMAVAIGLVLFVIYRIISSIMVKTKVRKVKSEYPEAKRYVDEVLAFDK